MNFFSAFAVLDPKGAIALSERALMFHALEFMLIVAVPVYFLLFFFAYKYRAGNKKATYMPNWEHGKMEELVWWVIPLEIVLVLGALTWSSTHELDPRRALSAEPPLVVQVVALDWKWLFIYPAEGVATVSYLQVPVGRPVEFMVTSDAPMNSFWIPQLGGQIYAMTGMTNTLNLVADHWGTYQGMSANYSGPGFAAMKFKTDATSTEAFSAWIDLIKVRQASTTLDLSSYHELARPSIIVWPTSYGAVAPGLYDAILMQFMSSVKDAGASGGAGMDPGMMGMHM